MRASFSSCPMAMQLSGHKGTVHSVMAVCHHSFLFRNQGSLRQSITCHGDSTQRSMCCSKIYWMKLASSLFTGC